MKNFLHQSIGAILITGSLINTQPTFAQTQKVEATSSVVTTVGTVSEFGPAGVTIMTQAGATPVRYIHNETTNYVDEYGNPVNVAMVKAGLPVTVYYTKVGDTLYASKVMVRGGLAGSSAAVATTHAATTSVGTISQFGSGQFVIKTEASPDPLQYSYSKTTTYVDEGGQPVSIETVKSGLPVTVYYTKVGNVLMASKVIVRKSTTLVPSPVVEQKTTTTTTTRQD